jgi:hypothetical protein
MCPAGNTLQSKQLQQRCNCKNPRSGYEEKEPPTFGGPTVTNYIYVLAFTSACLQRGLALRSQ